MDDMLPSSDMSESDASSDGRISPRAPVMTYSRKTLLALYDSPLVPARLPGMKDLAEWYGDFTDHPSSPQQNHRQQQVHHTLHSDLSRSSNPTAPTSAASRAATNARPNPFANFGRFGLDGGLEGDAAVPTSRASRDAAPHIPGAVAIAGSARRAPSPERAKYGASPTSGQPPGAYFSNERERSDRMRARELPGSTARGERERAEPGVGGRERRDREDAQKREGRAEEGGWRSVATSDRDRRLGGRNGPSTGGDRDSRRENGRDNNNRDNGRDNGRDNDRNGRDQGPRGSNRPAWMDDDQPSSASSTTPAWMDAPVSSTGLSFAAGSGGDEGGAIDSIQAFKAQMKEEERRRREADDRRFGGVSAQDEPDAGRGASRAHPQNELSIDLPAPHALAQAVDGHSPLPPGLPAPANGDFVVPGVQDSRPSVFETLGLGGQTSASAGGRGAAEGGRSSRFAKFFDAGAAKPAPVPAPAPAPPAPSGGQSIFGELMGGMAKQPPVQGAPEPSREDQESMARLLGMLQFSGQPREPSPKAATSPPPPPSQPQQPSQPTPPAQVSRSRQASAGGSRFAFSQPASGAPEQAPTPAVQAQQPHSHRFAHAPPPPLSSPPVAFAQPQPFAFPPHQPRPSPPAEHRAQFSPPAALQSPPLSNGQSNSGNHQQQYFSSQPPAVQYNGGPSPFNQQQQQRGPPPPMARPEFAGAPNGMPLSPNGLPPLMGPPRSMGPNGPAMYPAQSGFALPPPGMRPLPPPNFRPPPQGAPYGYMGPPPPPGYLPGPPFPPQQQRMPPPQQPYMMGPGVPDLMSLLNSGMGAPAGMRPMQRPPGSDVRQYME